ncbi:zeatin O-glucosyltransferase-like [Dorcoceras hygrometricum]|uniref:Zeatin O-glucosyltransferase-like n=1 Tax=Dorcoceras hygrometricum TaxID=472368 RepID=A0A2Z7C8C5_9LAMI|nr:zeatin O-glucosyltransferase-like [Dorcoceras hygrometricum]
MIFNNYLIRFLCCIGHGLFKRLRIGLRRSNDGPRLGGEVSRPLGLANMEGGSIAPYVRRTSVRVTPRPDHIEHEGPLVSLGLNGAGDDLVDFMPTDDVYKERNLMLTVCEEKKLNHESDVDRRKDEFSSKMQEAVFSSEQKMDSAVEDFSSRNVIKSWAAVRCIRSDTRRISCWNDEQKMKQISAGADENNQLKHIQNQQLMSDTKKTNS